MNSASFKTSQSSLEAVDAVDFDEAVEQNGVFVAVDGVSVHYVVIVVVVIVVVVVDFVLDFVLDVT